MKIGFFGNTNNYPFVLASAMRRLGCTVAFIVDQADPLYRPTARALADGEPAPDWITDVSPLRFRHFALPNPRMHRALTILRNCDAVVLNQYGASLAHRIRRPSIALLTGSDVYLFANPSVLDAIAPPADRILLQPKAISFRYFARRLIAQQRLGISRSIAVSYIPIGLVPAADQILSELGVSAGKRLSLLFTDAAGIRPAPPPLSAIPRLLCIARLNWKKPYRTGTTGLDYKGTDVMLSGIARYVQTTRAPITLRLVRKGLDIRETEQLVHELGLRSHVVWLDEMEQRELYREIAEADIVFDQFGESFPGMGALDAMALGRPVIANWRPDIVPPYRAVIPQLCHAETADEICLQLQQLLRNSEHRKVVGDRARQLVEERFSAEAAAKICLDRLEEALGKELTCSRG